MSYVAAGNCPACGWPQPDGPDFHVCGRGLGGIAPACPACGTAMPPGRESHTCGANTRVRSSAADRASNYAADRRRRGLPPRGERHRRESQTGDWRPTSTPPTGYADDPPLVRPDRIPPSGGITPPPASRPRSRPRLETIPDRGSYREPDPALLDLADRDPDVRIASHPGSHPPNWDHVPLVSIRPRPDLLISLGDECHWCGTHLTATSITTEHLTAADGDTPENLVAACRPCVTAKANRTEDEFLAWLHRIVDYLQETSRWTER